MHFYHKHCKQPGEIAIKYLSLLKHNNKNLRRGVVAEMPTSQSVDLGSIALLSHIINFENGIPVS